MIDFVQIFDVLLFDVVQVCLLGCLVEKEVIILDIYLLIVNVV